MTWSRSWPWGAVSLGLCLVAAYAHSASRFLPRPPSGEDRPRRAEGRPELAAEEEEILDLCRGERYEEALCRTVHCLERRDLNAVEEAAFRLIQAKLLDAMGKPDESAFLRVIHSRGAGRQRAAAYEGLARVRYARGDYDGAIRILEDLIRSDVEDGGFRGSSIMEVEANYRHWAAMGISACYLKMGKGKEAYRWALRAKYVWPFDSFCGNAMQAAHEEVENRLCESARLAGIAHTRESFDWTGAPRRRYGPPLGECLIGTGAGGLLVLAGGWGLYRHRRDPAGTVALLMGAVLAAAPGVSILWILRYPEMVGGAWAESLRWARGAAGAFAAAGLPLLVRGLWRRWKTGTG